MYANGAYFEFKKKKGMCLPHVPSIKKETVLKLLEGTVYNACLVKQVFICNKTKNK